MSLSKRTAITIFKTFGMVQPRIKPGTSHLGSGCSTVKAFGTVDYCKHENCAALYLSQTVSLFVKNKGSGQPAHVPIVIDHLTVIDVV